MLLPSLITCLCETGQSSYTSTKVTYYHTLNIEGDMRIQLSSIKPDFKTLKRFTQMYSVIFLTNCFGKYGYFS